ncbi:transposase [Catellatospora coxensis]
MKLGVVPLAVAGPTWCRVPEGKNGAGARPWCPRLSPPCTFLSFVSSTGSAGGAVCRWRRDGGLVEILYERVAGIDVHKRQVTVTARTPGGPGRGRQEKTRTFKTFYADLLAMASWLVELQVTHVAMESTGVYWWPVHAALAQVGGEGLTVEVVNAAHVKAVPGRKTDVKDAQWLARLMEVGLLRGSFIPPREVRRLRDLTRYQTKLTEERSREKQRLLKTLKPAGSSSTTSRRTPSGCPGGRCWRRWPRASVTRWCWRAWPVGCCATRPPSCGWRCRAASTTTTASWSLCTWPVSTTLTTCWARSAPVSAALRPMGRACWPRSRPRPTCSPRSPGSARAWPPA